MNWLDTETKELLQKVQDEKLAPPKTAEFGLVLVRKGNDYNRLTRAVVQINKCSERDAAKLASSQPPVVINPDLTEGEALWGQFELICSDAISLFLRSEVLEQNDRAYLDKLFNQVSHSDEFKPCTICLVEVPQTDFTLPNERTPSAEDVLDGAFEREDVARFGEIDFLNQSGEGRGFPATGRPANDRETVGRCHQLLQIRMQIQPINRGLETCQQPDREANAARRVHNVDAAPHTTDGFGEVRRSLGQEVLPRVVA